MKSFNVDMKQTVIMSQVKDLESQFVKKVNGDIARKVTPLYNIFMLESAAGFAYFLMTTQPQCYAKGKQVWASETVDVENVTYQFFLLSAAGLVLMILGALMYALQARGDLFEMMRPYVILTNLITLTWFIILQAMRFKETGRACSGDYQTA